MTWSYCAQTVKDLDPDRFLVVLNLPKKQHDPNFALIAFNCEVAKTASVVTQEMLGHIRFQWWREAIDELFTSRGNAKKVRQHEVVQAMIPLVDIGIPKHLLHLIIDAHVEDLSGQPLQNADALELYCAKTAGTLLRLQGIISANTLSDEADRQLNHLGTAWALSTMAFNPVRSRLIPSETSNEELSQLASENLSRFNKSSLCAGNRRLSLHAKVIEQRLNLLSQANFEASLADINRFKASLPLKLWLAKFRK